MDRQLSKPLSLATSLQGNAQAFGAALGSEPVLIAAALFVIYIILGVLYESAIHPDLSTLPAAGVGALLMLMAFGLDLSVLAIIGIISSDRQREEERDHAGRRGDGSRAGRNDAGGCDLSCLHPALPAHPVTTMAAPLGAVPLMVRTGTGSEIRQPLGYAIAGELLASQLLTFYTTPVVNPNLDRVQAWFGGKRRRAEARKQLPVPAE